jgi:hypothetical protein
MKRAPGAGSAYSYIDTLYFRIFFFLIFLISFFTLFWFSFNYTWCSTYSMHFFLLTGFHILAITAKPSLPSQAIAKAGAWLRQCDDDAHCE